MSMDKKKIEELAKRLRDAEQTGKPCAPLRDALDKGDIDAAYAIQNTNTQYWIKQGRRPTGRKVGLTAKTVQKQLGVDQPDSGILYADLCVGDGVEIAMSRVMQPKVEAEVALVLERDLKMEKPTVAEVISATAYALPAIEVVCSRIANWDINIQDTIADNASLGLYVLGGPKRRLDDLDLRLCGMVMECQGEQISVGAGMACLGNPLNAAAWLAATMVEVGMPLSAGDTIMTGSLGAMAPVTPGAVVEARIGGLGSVRAAFGPEE
ncbi:MAG: fumarylacetoacetate hydrolase family protein [Alphaproteobacteria bacterium]|nr:fumarylacetoacetate hydrolase family protein [Alphaproteobacteria bacterium]